MERLTLTLFVLIGIVSLFEATPLVNDGRHGPEERATANDLPSLPLKLHEVKGRMNQVEAIDLLRRLTREAAKQPGNPRGSGGCKYRKGQWSACDPQTKVRTRTFTLKKGDASTCEATKTLRKECKVKKAGKQRNQKNRNGGAKVQSPEKMLRSSN